MSSGPMPDQPKPVTRRTIGRPIRLTDEEIAHAAEVGPADIADAKEFWRRYAPPGYKGLLDAGEG